MNSIFFGISLFFGLILAACPLVYAQTDDFTSGYNAGISYDKRSTIGNMCLDQSTAWCLGFLSGLYDSHLNTSSHTTITIRESSHHPEGKICHAGNCTKGPSPTPKPTPTPPPTPPKGNGT